MASPSDLRKQLRAARRALSAAQRSEYSARICAHLVRSHVFRAYRRIATYIPMDSEADPGAILAPAWQRSKRVFLPVIMAPFQNQLRFAPYIASTALRHNRYGIPEPAVERDRFVSGLGLDVVLVPLVGFDATGARLGMGGGFYDRSFAFRLHRTQWRKPLLIGVAFEAQRVSTLTRNAWDVPLDNVLTEAGFLW